MKRKYEPAELEIVWLDLYDVITSSLIPPDDGEDEEGIGGGYNPGGWT